MLTAYCLQLTAYLPLTAYSLLLTAYYLLLTPYCLLLTGSTVNEVLILFAIARCDVTSHCSELRRLRGLAKCLSMLTFASYRDFSVHQVFVVEVWGLAENPDRDGALGAQVSGLGLRVQGYEAFL